jgi:peroxiredoxin
MFTLLASIGVAQGKLRDVAPNFEAQFTNTEARALGDFRGRVVLLDFWRTSNPTCRQDVPHLNELARSYGDRGLVVIGITNEDPATVAEALKNWKPEFVIARVMGPKTDVAYGVEAFPSAFLIDAKGRIAWSGAPADFDEKLLKGLLAEVVMVKPLPAKHRDINEMLERRRLGKAYEAVERGIVQQPADSDLARAKSEIASALQRRLDEAKSLADASDFGLALDAYDDVARMFTPMPGAQAAEAAADSIRRDPATKDELAAHAQMKKGEELSARGERDAAIQTWQRLMERYPESKAAKRAKVALRQRGML